MDAAGKIRIAAGFSRSFRIIESDIASSMMSDPSSVVMDCTSAPNVCTLGGMVAGFCRNVSGEASETSSASVTCYGCYEKFVPCNGLQVHLLAHPLPFVAAGEHTIRARIHDSRCNISMLVDGGKSSGWRPAGNIEPLPVGLHMASFMAVCPDGVTGPQKNISWEVIDGRDTNTTITGPDLIRETTASFSLGANKADCEYDYWLDDEDVQSQPFAGSSSTLEAAIIHSLPHWPHSAILLSSGSSAGIGTSVSLILEDGGDGDDVVAERQVIVNENGEAPTVFRGLDAGAHRLQATMSSAGLEAVAETAFTVVEGEIDTFLRGAAVMDRALFTLDSTQPLSTEYYEYSLDGNEWTIHRENHLYVGPMALGEHVLAVRAVSSLDGSKDSFPARFMWTVKETPEARINIAPTDSPSAYALASAVSKRDPAATFWYSIDDGPKVEGKPDLVGPLSPGWHTLRVGRRGPGPGSLLLDAERSNVVWRRRRCRCSDRVWLAQHARCRNRPSWTERRARRHIALLCRLFSPEK